MQRQAGYYSHTGDTSYPAANTWGTGMGGMGGVGGGGGGGFWTGNCTYILIWNDSFATNYLSADAEL